MPTLLLLRLNKYYSDDISAFNLDPDPDPDPDPESHQSIQRNPLEIDEVFFKNILTHFYPFIAFYCYVYKMTICLPFFAKII
jgi:hypothetical protein